MFSINLYEAHLQETPERYDVSESHRGPGTARAHERPNCGFSIEQVVELVDRLSLVALHTDMFIYLLTFAFFDL